ncbi:MAG: ATP-binding protein [Cloacibacillus evryensis]
MDAFRKYIVVGGMPKAVAEYADKGDFNYVTAVQKSLANAYVADMAKYASPQETTRILAAWSSVPGQLAKENHKFQYNMIKSGARSSEYDTPLAWLEAAGIVYRCTRVTQGALPLMAYADNSSFKIYLADTGILCSKFGISPNIIMGMPHAFDQFKGALIENYVMQGLIVNEISPFYWNPDNRSEVDFVFQNRLGQVIPIEVKSSDNVRSRSLSNYCADMGLHML